MTTTSTNPVQVVSDALVSIRIGAVPAGSAGIWTPCTYRNDQAWYYSGSSVSFLGYTWYQLENGNGQCLGVKGGGTGNGTPVVGYTCENSNHPDQYWAFLNQVCGGNYYPLVNGDGVVIGVKGGTMKNGQPVIAFSYQDTCNNQFWHAEQLAGG